MSAIGRLKHLVSLQKPTRTTDTGGGQAITFTTVAQIYVDIRPVSGKEAYEQGQLKETRTAEITTRYRDVLDTSFRILFGTRAFNIKHIKNVDERNKIFVLTCEEGVAT